MNYLAELLAFSEWKEVNPLPASAIALWHELMAICNKAGWIQEFTVPNGLLQAKCGLSRKEFDYARSLLINFGRIKYRKSERVNQAGKYQIVSFVQKGQQEGQQEGQREEHERDNGRDNERDTLYKLKLKQKQKNNTPISPFADYTTNEELIETLIAFVEMRNKIKKPMTDKAIKLMLNKLDDLASDDEMKIAILNQSIMNCWQGIFALKEQQKNNRDTKRAVGEDLPLI